MRSLNQYRLAEWARAQPLEHLYHQIRLDAKDRLYRARRPRALEPFLDRHAHLAGGTVAIAVAYNTPWVIDVLTRTARLHLGADALIVLDNSRRPEARAAIEHLCRAQGVSYFALPSNPMSDGSRSHGIALNWAYYNVVRRLRPRVFAFLDHDLFLLQRLELAALVATQPFYGAVTRLTESNWGWNLWAGYCIYDYAAVRDYPLNFSPDNGRGLDTGGRNYRALYRHFDRSRIRFADLRTEVLIDSADGGRHGLVQIIDGAVHVCGAAYSPYVARERVGHFYERLVRACEAGATLATFRAGAGNPHAD
jgi:hypothetical protein